MLTGDAQPYGPQSYLLRGFFTGDIHNRSVCVSQVMTHLQEKCGLSNTRLATEKNQRSGHETTAENPVELRYSQAYPWRFVERH